MWGASLRLLRHIDAGGWFSLLVILLEVGIPPTWRDSAIVVNYTLGEDVRQELMAADWVSLKVDATREEVWRKIDRPHGKLRLASTLDGMLEFAHTYQGELVTETMLVEGVNDEAGHLMEMADFLGRLVPARAYLSIPTRPPAEAWVQPPQ